MGGIVRRAHGGLSAGGAAFGHPENGRGAERVVVDRAQHSGDHVSGAFHGHPIAGPYVPLPDVILVMQGGALDGDAADGDGFQDGYGGELAEASDADADVFEGGGPAFGGELPGDGPAGFVAGCAHNFAVFRQVGFHFDAVGVVVQGFPLFQHGLEVSGDGFGEFGGDGFWVDGKAALRQFGQRLAVGRRQGAARGLVQAVSPELEAASGGFLDVVLSDGSGGRVPRVGVGVQSFRFPVAVEVGEPADGQVDFAADVGVGQRRVEAFRDAGYGCGGGSHVFAGRAVAPGGGQG